MTDPGPAPDTTAPVPGPGDADAGDLAARLAAERAGTEYWRDVARQRRVDAARVQRRPLVRVAVAVDRRTQAIQHAAAERAHRVAAGGRRAALVASGLRHRSDRTRRRAELRDQLDAVATRDPADGSEQRPILVIHLGPVPPIDARKDVEVVAAPGRAGEHPDGVPAPATDVVAAIDLAVERSDAELVCLLGPDARPLTGSWLDHLAAPISGPIVATVPVVLHPDRPWSSATPHDLMVRWSGLDVAVDADGTPVATARGAGAAPDLTAPGVEVDAATGSCVMVARRAWLAAGGLTGPTPAARTPETPVLGGVTVDAAVVDLSIRLRRAGGAVHSVPTAAVVDDRAVTSAADLAGPLAPDSPGWRRVVEANGPALVRRADPGTGSDAPRPATVAITTATPSRKIAQHSGDWHYAGLVAGALERAGHPVRLQTIEEADSLAGRACDLHLVLRGLEPVRRTAGQRHVLWVISHPESLDLAECDAADLVVVASRRFAEHLRTQTATPVEVLLQATEPRHFHRVTPDPAHRHPVTIVANSRGVRRAAVADALAAGLTPAVYGQGWRDLLDPSLIASDYAAMDELPTVYSSADVVLNDHWDTMRHWGFVSNRIFDVLACGTPVVSDHLPEIGELFGTLVPTWRTPAELAASVADLAGDPAATAARTASARRLVLDAHTFDHRVTELTELLRRHGLQPDTGETA